MPNTYLLTAPSTPITNEIEVQAGTYQLDLLVPDHECEVQLQQLFGDHWDNIGGILPDNTHSGSRSATLGPFVLTEGSRIRLGYPFAKYPEGVAAALYRVV